MPERLVEVYRGDLVESIHFGHVVISNNIGKVLAYWGNPKGHKRKEGDGKTPEGSYWITHKNPNSAFHKSLGISYPNKQDKIYAEQNGFSPGKDIFIHGGPRNFLKHFFFDWTEGCIAVTNSEIEEIYNLVNENTPIFIKS